MTRTHILLFLSSLDLLMSLSQVIPILFFQHVCLFSISRWQSIVRLISLFGPKLINPVTYHHMVKLIDDHAWMRYIKIPKFVWLISYKILLPFLSTTSNTYIEIAKKVLKYLSINIHIFKLFYCQTLCLLICNFFIFNDFSHAIFCGLSILFWYFLIL